MATLVISALVWFGAWSGGFEWFITLALANWLITLVVLSLAMGVVLWMIDLEPLVRGVPSWLQPFARFFLGVRSKESLEVVPEGGITVVIPAHQEARDIKRTLRKLRKQTLKPSRVIVIDDGSTDKTSEYARSMGANVFYQERVLDTDTGEMKTQGKAAAQKRGLSLVKTEFVIFIDADTSLARDALEKLMSYFNEPKTAAVGGFVLPYYVRNFWEAVRHFQYMFGFSVLKAGQNNTGTVFVSSGCFTGFRTNVLREVGLGTGMAEDLSTTRALLEKKHHVRFAPDAVCYVVDPDNLWTYVKQGYRWNAGSFQELKKRKFNLFPIGFWFAIFTYFNIVFSLLGPILEVAAFWWIQELVYSNFFAKATLEYALSALQWPIADVLEPAILSLIYPGALLLSVAAAIVIGLLISLVFTFFLTWIPVMYAAYGIRHNKRLWLTAWTVFPFIVVRYLDVTIYYAAFWDEIILRKRLNRWDKGHTEDTAPSLPSLSAVPKNSPMLLAHKALAYGVIDEETARNVSVLNLK